jgi:hypothetical protein
VKYTLHQRSNDFTTGQITSPGPAAYTPDYMATKRTAPISTLHVRPGDHSLDVNPDPSDYVIDRGLGGLQPTMHQRIEPRQSSNTSGPRAYESQSRCQHMQDPPGHPSPVIEKGNFSLNNIFIFFMFSMCFSRFLVFSLFL